MDELKDRYKSMDDDRTACEAGREILPGARCTPMSCSNGLVSENTCRTAELLAAGARGARPGVKRVSRRRSPTKVRSPVRKPQANRSGPARSKKPAAKTPATKSAAKKPAAKTPPKKPVAAPPGPIKVARGRTPAAKRVSARRSAKRASFRVKRVSARPPARPSARPKKPSPRRPLPEPTLRPVGPLRRIGHSRRPVMRNAPVGPLRRSSRIAALEQKKKATLRLRR